MTKYKKFIQLNENERKHLIKDIRKVLIDTVFIEDILIPEVIIELATNIKIQDTMINNNESIKNCNVIYRDKLIDTSSLLRDMFNRAISERRYYLYSRKALEYDTKVNKFKKNLKLLKSSDYYIPLFEEFRELEIEELKMKIDNAEIKKERYEFEMKKYYNRIKKWI